MTNLFKRQTIMFITIEIIVGYVIQSYEHTAA